MARVPKVIIIELTLLVLFTVIIFYTLHMYSLTNQYYSFVSLKANYINH